MMEKISIIVPVYRVEKYIQRCVDSILNQTYQNFELILVNDGSPDNSGMICDLYAGKDERILVFHQQNKGLSEARNVAIDYVCRDSNSKWITFIDSDDWVHPRYLQTLYESVVNYNMNVGIISYVNSKGEIPEINFENYKSELMCTEDFWMQHRTNATIACGKLYKKECFREIRYPRGKIHEDEYTTYQILFKEQKVVFTSAPLYFYYINPDSITQTQWNLKSLDCLDALKGQADYFKRNNFKRACKSSSQLYLDKLFYSRQKLRDSQLNHSIVQKEVGRKLNWEMWKYGLICNYVPIENGYYAYKAVLKVRKILLKKKRNLKEVLKI